jgi:hypothetical protein
MSERDTTHDPRSSVDRGDRASQSPNAAALYKPIDVAAPRLGVSEEALRARCRRARKCTGGTVVDLGGGIRAVKFGRTWRVRFPDDVPR